MSKQHEVWSDDVVTFHLEDFQGRWFLHCEVHKWGRHKYKHIKKVFLSLTKEFKERDINELYAITPNPEFAAMFGFEGCVRFKHSDGKYWETMICRQV